MELKLKNCVTKKEIFENGTILLDLRSNAVENRKDIFNTLCALGFDPNIDFIRITREVAPFVITLIDDKFQCQHFYMDSRILEEDNTDSLRKALHIKGIRPKDYLNAIASRSISEYLNEEII